LRRRRSHGRRRIDIGGDIVTEARMVRIDITEEDGLIHDREVRVGAMIREMIDIGDEGTIVGRDIHDDDAIRMRGIGARNALVAETGVRDAPTAETDVKIEMETSTMATDKMEILATDETVTTATETAMITDETGIIATREMFAITETVETTEKATPPTVPATTQKTTKPKKKSASAN